MATGALRRLRSTGGGIGAMHPVMTPQQLAALLSGPEPPTVSDVRWSLTGPPGRVDYSAGHLPSAVFIDVDTDLAGPRALEDAPRSRGARWRNRCVAGGRATGDP